MQQQSEYHGWVSIDAVLGRTAGLMNGARLTAPIENRVNGNLAYPVDRNHKPKPFRVSVIMRCYYVDVDNNSILFTQVVASHSCLEALRCGYSSFVVETKSHARIVDQNVQG